MKENPLGQSTRYFSTYKPDLLFPIPRNANRDKIGIGKISFSGFDLWNLYEMSWLDSQGKPIVARGELVYSADSEFIVESKSLKLYLGSFNMTVFESFEAVKRTIEKDLKDILNASFVEVHLFDYKSSIIYRPIKEKNCIDDLDVKIKTYNRDPGLLKTGKGKKGVQKAVSNVLKSNCPITGQPDWGTVEIEYQAEKSLDRKGLLKYIVSFREEGDYHEACCEQIFYDIYTVLKPSYLSVGCYYTRRGGIDINPYRVFGKEADLPESGRFWRQ